MATDEQNKTFFRDFKKQFKKIRYLDDYMKIAGLKELNPNYLGMIDQVICTRGTHFVGTWFSTFTGTHKLSQMRFSHSPTTPMTVGLGRIGMVMGSPFSLPTILLCASFCFVSFCFNRLSFHLLYR